VPPIIGRRVRLKLPTWPREYDGVVTRLHGPVLKEPGKGGKPRFGRVYEVSSHASDALFLRFAGDRTRLWHVPQAAPGAKRFTTSIPCFQVCFEEDDTLHDFDWEQIQGSFLQSPLPPKPDFPLSDLLGGSALGTCPLCGDDPEEVVVDGRDVKVLRKWIGRDGKQVPVIPLSMPMGTVVRQTEASPYPLACLHGAGAQKPKKGEAFKLVASTKARSLLRRWSGHMTYWGSDAAKCWAGGVVNGNEPFTSVKEYQASAQQAYISIPLPPTFFPSRSVAACSKYVPEITKKSCLFGAGDAAGFADLHPRAGGSGERVATFQGVPDRRLVASVFLPPGAGGPRRHPLEEGCTERLLAPASAEQVPG
jgi:hypothetical protein